MARKKSISDFFLRSKPVKILIHLANSDRLRYASVLAKEVDCTYSHTVRILKILNDSGLVDFNKQGRLKTIGLTESGKELAQHFHRAVSLFEKIED